MKEEYIVKGNGPISFLAKKFLRFAGWEPDVIRSRTESTHFNEFLNLPILKEKPYSLYRYMQYVPVWMIRLFIGNVQETVDKQDIKELTSDYVHPEPVEGGVFVYQSVTEIKALKRFRTLEAPIIPTVLFFSNYPYASIVSLLTAVFFLYPRVYIPSRVLVGRMDVIPDRNELRIEKVTWFGRTKVSYMNPDDL